MADIVRNLPVALNSKDRQLARWSAALYVMAAVTALFTLSRDMRYLSGNCDIVVLKGQEIWSATSGHLKPLDFAALYILALPQTLAWLYFLLQISRLARYYRQGRVFEEGNALCFIRGGRALAAIGIIGFFSLTGSICFLYWRGTTPWLGDIETPYGIHYNFVLVGLFLFIWGKIMHRAAELEANNRLIV